MKINPLISAAVIIGGLVLFSRRASASTMPDGASTYYDDALVPDEFIPREQSSVFSPDDDYVENDFPLIVDAAADREDQSYFQPISTTGLDPMDSPNVRAFLDMIAFAEGAGYSTLFGGDTFDGFADHPRRIIRKSGYASSAAGRYQFLSTTWDDVSKKIGATSFDPYWQDRAAVYLIKRDGALADVIAGRFSTALYKVRKTWASLPGAGHNQPERNYDKLLTVYLNAGGGMITV